jgi:hypothetical protein
MATPYYNDPSWYTQNNPNIAAEAQRYGMSTSDYASYLASQGAANPMNAVTQQQTGQGMTVSVPNPNDNASMNQTLNTLGVMQKYGLGQGQQQSTPASIPGAVSSDPMNLAANMGAAALNMPAIYNPTPGQIPQGSKGGISAVASPVSSSTVPTMPTGPWSNQAGVTTTQGDAAARQLYAQYGGNVNTASPSDISTFYKGMTGNAPSNAVPAASTAGTPTPTAIPNPRGQQAATPFAQAPAAPGLQMGAAIPPVSAAAPPPAPGGPDHEQALAHAGMAMYAHYGGDPSTATPEDINNFHSQLIGHIGSIFGGPGQSGVPSQAQPQGAAQAGATALASGMPAKMATGGMVPGRGNQDTVPALLTPGEYVIPKQQAAQIFGGRQPIRMADGGMVQQGQPAETRHKALVNPVTGQAVGEPSNAPSNQQSSSSINPAPDAPGGGPISNGPSWAQIAAQKAQMAQNVGTLPSGAPGLANPNSALPDIGGGLTAAGGPPPGTQTAMAAGAISDLANGLTKAAQTYAASFKDWHMQSDETKKFAQNVGSSGPAATFSQDTA